MLPQEFVGVEFGAVGTPTRAHRLSALMSAALATLPSTDPNGVNGVSPLSKQGSTSECAQMVRAEGWM